MYFKSLISGASTVEAPTVSSVNFQVRTGVSAPFEPHMTGEEAPKVGSVNFQVRTGVSAPFEPHMTGDEKPTEAASGTRVAVPVPSFMVSPSSE